MLDTFDPNYSFKSVILPVMKSFIRSFSHGLLATPLRNTDKEKHQDMIDSHTATDLQCYTDGVIRRSRHQKVIICETDYTVKYRR